MPTLGIKRVPVGGGGKAAAGKAAAGKAATAPAASNNEGEGKPRRAIKTFDERLEELRAYKAKHWHLNVKMGEDKSLYRFCVDIRKARRGTGRMKLTKERIASLNALEFDWVPLSEKDKSFQKRLEELNAYKAKHGHLKVKESEDKSLNKFCDSIRRARKGKGTMKLTEDRIASLDALGFEWEPNMGKSPKSFAERMEELKAYKAKHGHLKVKPNEDNSLYKFCDGIRCARRNPGGSGRMKVTEERIAALDGLGFDWDPQKTKTFEERLEELKEYKLNHGHIYLEKSEDRSLYTFCAHIRHARRNPESSDRRNLTEEDIASLDEIGFDWEPKKRGRSKEKIPPGECLTLPIVIHNWEPFGAEVGSETTGDGRRLARIVNVVAGSQAETAGLRAGDVPVSDGGRLSYDVFLQMVKGGVRPFTFQVYRGVNTRR